MPTETRAFDFLMIDPPWPKRKGGRRAARPRQGRALDYATMTVPAIFALLDDAVFTRATSQHTVWLWCVDQFLHEAETAMATRGYRLHARMIWDKENGVAPCFTIRYAHEYLLWFYKPKLTPVVASARGKHTTVLREKGRQHSRKPDIAYTLAETFWPDAERYDVFSRERRDGWDQFGDDVSHFVMP